MLPRVAVAAIVTLLMFPPAVAWSQSRDSAPQVAQDNTTNRLSETERQAFDARLKAAQTEQERAWILNERDSLIQSRATQQGDVRQIPPSASEAANDPIMSDVPTPRSERSWPYGTLPGGALAPTGSGTGPSTTTGGWDWGD